VRITLEDGDGTPRGLLRLGPRRCGAAYRPRELAALQQTARCVASALGRSRREPPVPLWRGGADESAPRMRRAEAARMATAWEVRVARGPSRPHAGRNPIENPMERERR